MFGYDFVYFCLSAFFFQFDVIMANNLSNLDVDKVLSKTWNFHSIKNANEVVVFRCHAFLVACFYFFKLVTFFSKNFRNYPNEILLIEYTCRRFKRLMYKSFETKNNDLRTLLFLVAPCHR